jgi:hypothetical protein
METVSGELFLELGLELLNHFQESFFGATLLYRLQVIIETKNSKKFLRSGIQPSKGLDGDPCSFNK